MDFECPTTTQLKSAAVVVPPCVYPYSTQYSIMVITAAPFVMIFFIVSLLQMDVAGILTQNVDKTQLPPLHQKRVLAFVNHFLISSCGFLNDFALQCETKFIELERKLQKLEASLIIIEAKLASIPDVGNECIKTTLTKETSSETTVEKDDKVDSSLKEIDESLKGTKASEHHAYKKFFKMLQVGVPGQAIKMKMQIEGLDPNILDNPNTIVKLEDVPNSHNES